MTSISLPGEMEGWLDQNSLARFVVEIVEHLDTSAIEAAYRAGGSAAYAPKMMLTLLFYCYAKGIFSSRKMEQATYELIPVLYITGGLHPDHDSINTFRRRFLEQLSPLFVEILQYSCSLGIFKLGDISIDGVKIKANASKHKAMSWDYACKLEKQLKQEVEPALEQLDQLPESLGKVEKAALDSGFFSEDNTKCFEAKGIEPYIASGRQNHNLSLEERLAPPPSPPINPDAVAAMKHRLKTEAGKEFYGKRKSTVEPVFGIIKEVMGFRRFMLRGFEAVTGEWTLVCIAFNLKRLCTLSV